VSSRQEEKERLRRERQQREEAEARKASMRRRLQLVGAGVVGLALIGGVVGAVVASGGGGGSSSGPKKSAAVVPIPARKITDFNAAIKASGCTYKNWPSEGRTHLPSDTSTYTKYKTNPPTSGPHRPVAAEDGVYAYNNPPATENAVHALEHGRIDIQYSPKASKLIQDQLQTFVNEKNKGVPGYHELLFKNQTDMPFVVAATAWTQSLTCKTMNDQVFDALRAFRDRFTDKGPELIP
jgi:hypothetical protein